MCVIDCLSRKFPDVYTQLSVTMLMLPARVDLGGFPTSFSPSLLDSSLLELFALGFAFLADGPFLLSPLIGGAFLFLASGDLGNPMVITLGALKICRNLILISKGSVSQVDKSGHTKAANDISV